MPYFKTNEINVLFIHIPKTGGTSLEKYFSQKYNIKLNNTRTLYSGNFNGANLRHNTYLNLMNTYHFSKYIDFNNLTIISIVRNPYERIVSDLFYLKLLSLSNKNTEDVFNIIKTKYFTGNHDNHMIPQHLFLTDASGNLIEGLKLLRTDNLTSMMHDIGFKDFNLHENKAIRNYNYMNYLNNDSIKLINEKYDKDFSYFGYEKIIV